MQNANLFKLGLFGMNCSGSFATTAPSDGRPLAGESRSRAAGDEAAWSLSCRLPAGWLRGQTDRQGTSFESLSWRRLAGLHGRDRRVLDIHVPLIHPVFAAKSM